MLIIEKIFFFVDPIFKKKIFILVPFIIFLTVIETATIGAIIPILNLFLDMDFVNNYPHLNVIFIKLSLLTYFNFANDKFAALITGAITFFLLLIIAKNLIFLFFINFKSYLLKEIHLSVQKKFLYNFFNTPYEFITEKNNAYFLNKENNIAHMIASIELYIVLISETVILSAILLLILYKDFSFGLISTGLFLLFLFYFFKKNRKKILNLGILKNVNEEKKISYLLNIFNGIKEIRLFKNEGYFYNFYNYYSSLTLNSVQKMSMYNAYPKALLEIFVILVATFFIFYFSFLEKDPKIILVSIGFLLFAAIRIAPSINRILLATQSLKYNVPFIEYLYQDLKNYDSYSTIKSNYIKINDSIKLDNIYFDYPKKKNKVLQKINLFIKKGEKIGIEGKSGLGKTTLINLIIGLLKPQKGKIIIDKKIINKNYILEKCAVVTSNVFFINNTLLENIYFGSGKVANLRQINEKIKDSQLQNFISNLSLGLNTEVADKGLKISSGQIQRINIARALYSNSDILIFDEATNALDPSTEKIVINNIFKKYADKTIVIISHKKTNFRHCTSIYKLNNCTLKKLK